MTDTSDDARLNEFDKDEWREITRRVRPDWTDEQFETAWADFCELKYNKKRLQ